jgi:hypothetical protein
LFLLLPLTVMAVESVSGRQLRHSGFYLAPGYAMARTPLFRQPSGSSEAAIPQNNSAILFAGGYEHSLRSIFFGLRFAYWRNTYHNFSYPEMPNSPYPVYVQYSNPKKTYIYGDIIAGWIPDKAGMFGLYGLLGLGSNGESYTLSGSDFQEWNGQKSKSEFNYSYGLGAKFTPIHLLSLFGEFRLTPGVASPKLKYLGEDEKYYYYEYLGTTTSNYTTALSIGLMINF